VHCKKIKQQQTLGIFYLSSREMGGFNLLALQNQMTNQMQNFMTGTLCAPLPFLLSLTWFLLLP
jgi:hypothetical protein